MKKKDELLLWLTAIMVLMFAASCNDAPRQTELRSVVLTSPIPASATSQKSYAGVVEEAHTINLGFKTAGQIAHIYIKEGDHISKGQLIAKLDDADYRLSVKVLQLQYDQTKREVERIRQLYQQRSISANDYEKAVSGLKQLGVQLQSSKNQLSYTRLVAPCNAKVQRVNLSASEMIAAGTPVFTLVDDSQMEVVCSVRSENCGAESSFSCRIVDTDEAFPLRFLSITPKADNSQLRELRLTFIEKPDRRIVAGMNAEVTINDSLLTEKEGAFAIPLTAVFEDGNGNPCVWVMKADSTLTKRTVTLSSEVLNGKVIVTSGLTGNERIVSSGAATLQEGEKVRPLEEPKTTNVGGLL